MAASDLDRRARKLLQAADIFRVCQYLSLAAGAACTRLIGGGAGTMALFGQAVATIVFGWIYSGQTAKLISARYPDLDPFRHLWTRTDRYTPLVRAAAVGQGDALTPALLDREAPLMFRAFVLVLVMALLEPLFAR